MFNKLITENLSKSSFIRAMFEEGNRLKAIHGEENVFDFSIGNPDMEPPLEVKERLLELAQSKEVGMHKYMGNAGYDKTRQAISDSLYKDYNYRIPKENIIMTTGAAAGLYTILKSILNPGDEVVVFKPYFAEYGFYTMHSQGVLVTCDYDKDFMPNEKAFEKVLSEKTKVVLINTPNNPTGVIYPKEKLQRLNEIIKRAEEKFGTKIYLVSDEPYVKIVYDDTSVPCVFDYFDKAIIVNSFSKSLALPGERIGYIAIDPKIEACDLLVNICVFNTRTLGYVNAPALMQRVIEVAADAQIDIKEYKERRDILYNHMKESGFQVEKPKGAFYLFVKSPVEDEMEFVNKAKEYNILIVPGRGFGAPGYVRMSFCIKKETIKRSLPQISLLAKEYFK